MSPDKVASASSEPAATTPDLIPGITSNGSNSNSSSGSSISSTSGGGSLSRSPTGDRNNNLHSNPNNNSNTSTGSISQSNAILHLTPQSVIQAANQQSVIISTTAAVGAVQQVRPSRPSVSPLTSSPYSST